MCAYQQKARASYEMLGRMEVRAKATMLASSSDSVPGSLASRTGAACGGARASSCSGVSASGGHDGTREVFILAAADAVEEALRACQVSPLCPTSRTFVYIALKAMLQASFVCIASLTPAHELVRRWLSRAYMSVHDI
jgi:hypothetical protein